jgi:hypothetical protein
VVPFKVYDFLCASGIIDVSVLLLVDWLLVGESALLRESVLLECMATCTACLGLNEDLNGTKPRVDRPNAANIIYTSIVSLLGRFVVDKVEDMPPFGLLGGAGRCACARFGIKEKMRLTPPPQNWEKVDKQLGKATNLTG